MAKKTQINLVKEILARDGSVSRNQCLSLRITRLSAIILKLRGMGYDFTTSERGGDYVYTLSTQPIKAKAVQLVYDPIKGVMVRT